MKRLILTALLLLTSALFTNTTFIPKPINVDCYDIICTEDTRPPYKQVLDGLLEAGVDLNSAKIMTAQASFESGYFKNPLTVKSKNSFAIHHTSCRPTFSLGKGGEAEGHSLFARYYTLDSAAKDFPLYLKYIKVSTKVKSIDEYAYTLKSKNYYGSDAALYARGIHVHYKKLFGESKR